MNLDLARHDRVGDGLVIDQMFHRLTHLRLGQILVLLVQPEIVDRALRPALKLDVGIVLQRSDILGREVTGDVDIAFLQQQALRRGFGDVAVDRAGHRRLVARVILVALQHDDLVGAPVADRERTRARVVDLQPFIAEIAVGLVLHHHLLVHDRGDGRRQAVEHQRRRIGLVHLEVEAVIARRDDHLIDILGVQAELGQDEGGRLVELDRAHQRKHRVLGGDRVARGEGPPFLDLERDGLAILRDGPAFRDLAEDVGHVLRVVANQRLVGVPGDLGCGELEYLGGIERNDIVDRPGLDERIGRGFGHERGGRCGHKQCAKRSACQ